jgi:hypothetical protein
MIQEAGGVKVVVRGPIKGLIRVDIEEEVIGEVIGVFPVAVCARVNVAQRGNAKSDRVSMKCSIATWSSIELIVCVRSREKVELRPHDFSISASLT